MGLNTKCKVHGNAHPDFMCPDEDEDTTSFARSLAAARLEVAAKESELSVVQRDLNGANAYIEEVRNQRDRVEAEVAAYKAARDCTINNGWLQEGLECSVDGDPACGLHLKRQLDASRALVEKQRRAMGVIEHRFVPHGGCDSPGHDSPDICWWLGILALTEADMLERMEADMLKQDEQLGGESCEC